jgi:membrane-associated phospholipid phosphatase
VIVLVPIAVVALVLFGAVCLAVHHWPRQDLTAPHLTERIIEREVRLHPHLASFLRRRVDPGLLTGLVLTAAALGIAAIGLLLVMVREQIGLASFDQGAAEWAARQASENGARILLWISQVGGTETMIIAGVIVLVIEHRRIPHRPAAGLLVLTLAGQAALANLIKWLVGRARPELEQLSGSWGAAFPSGHATTAAATFAVVAMLLGRGRSRPVRAALAGTAAGAAGAVAASRVLLGVHWLTDVLAGLVLGWTWFALCSMAFGGRRLHFGEPAEQAEEDAEAQRPEPASRG